MVRMSLRKKESSRKRVLLSILMELSKSRPQISRNSLYRLRSLWLILSQSLNKRLKKLLKMNQSKKSEMKLSLKIKPKLARK